jgi:hypothetical protein
MAEKLGPAAHARVVALYEKVIASFRDVERKGASIP